MRLAARRLTVAAALLTAAPALAQDAPKEPAAPPAKDEGAKPAEPAAPAQPAERKVDPKAVEALERYRGLMHSPAGLGGKEVTAAATAEAMGATIPFKVSWSAEKSIRVSDVSLPPEILAQVPQGMEEQVQQMVGGQIQMLVGPAFGFSGKYDEFDMAFKAKAEGGGTVDLTPRSETSSFDTLRFEMGADGLMQQMVFTLRLPPDNPMAAQLAGVEFENAYTYEKKGEKHVVTGATMTNPMAGEATSTITYYEAQGAFLPKAIVAATMQGEQTLTFHDYTSDGKPVAGTEAPKAAAKPAEGPRQPDAPVGPGPGPEGDGK